MPACRRSQISNLMTEAKSRLLDGNNCTQTDDRTDGLLHIGCGVYFRFHVRVHRMVSRLYVEHRFECVVLHAAW
eukprot:953607-Pleurochrysis_carterae.AAC.1